MRSFSNSKTNQKTKKKKDKKTKHSARYPNGLYVCLSGSSVCHGCFWPACGGPIMSIRGWVVTWRKEGRRFARMTTNEQMNEKMRL